MGIIVGSLEQGFIYAIMALGVYLAFRILDYPDLTVDGSFPLGAAVSALLIVKGANPFFAILCAVIAGGLAGMITGLLHTKGKINGLLAGILTMTALYSINLKVMGTSNLSLIRQDTIFTPLKTLKKYLTETFNQGLIVDWVVPVVYTAVLLFSVVLIKKIIDWFLKTDLGLAIRATGDNPEMIRSFGVSTNKSIMIGLILSNALVGLAGGIMAQYQGYADVQMGIGMIVVGLASVIIGEVIFGTKSLSRTTLAVIGGAVIYRLVIALSLNVGLSPTDLKLITAVLVIIALTFPNLSLKQKKSKLISKIQGITFSNKKSSVIGKKVRGERNA